ncbi:MAG: cystathionine gamma-synthase [Micropruina sp.]|nr:cystathionine gamma-synthase [Micropruina sp.]
MTEPNPATAAVRAGLASDPSHHAVVPPIYLSTNYVFTSPGESHGYEYSRSANPTRQAFASAVAGLEGAANAVIASSGMGAVNTVLHALSAPGDVVVAPFDCYGGSWRLLTALAEKGLFELVLVDFSDPAALAAALARRPSQVWLETPSNPLLRITDIADVAAHAHAVGAVVVVDNTFASPVGQAPLRLGADLVIHSTTKYINGHSDVIGGAIIAADPALHERMDWWANTMGVTAGALDSYLALRGLRTLHVRMRAHEENALALAKLAQGHPGVEAVYYPGLPDHPGHDIAVAQMSCFGGMLTVTVKHGRRGVDAFLDGLRYICLAESLGGVESLVAHPLTMTHAAMTADVAARAGLVDGMLRISVGIEDKDDLIADLSDAFDRVAALTD